MRNLAVLVFIVSFFAACTKEKLNNELVEGSWKWESTSFGERPSTSRPATDKIYILVFKSDKKFTYEKNGNLIRYGTYEVKKQKSNLRGKDEYLLTYSDSPIHYIIEKVNDRLYLSIDAWDGAIGEYSKY